ncbi:MAG: phosphoglycerate kinase [Candidatus Sungiibacteriota bacterium]|uniref:Phosphoglycerate kinase n=1 Tax=Candidatus Sungiibacteriota bacterium TaxID=2750080 RepID=A0A7T5UQ55_9BACT|nr:MAG: phosphoglycerate kinase [Candidatus Sungbacteria bacterium]
MTNDVNGKRVLMRVDFNVPLEGGRVVDDFRIAVTLPTIKGFLAGGAQLLLATHLEQDKEIPHLEAVHKVVEDLLGEPVRFLPGLVGEPYDLEERVVLFDNLRLNPGEKANDLEFARLLASWGELYINEAFSVSHRPHASIVSVPRFLPSGFGSLFQREVNNLSKAFDPLHPFLLILGGKKFDTKTPLLENLIKTADVVFIGGSIGNSFMAARGLRVGRSRVEPISLPKEILWGKKIVLSEDVVVEREKKVLKPEEVTDNDIIYDVGPQTVEALLAVAKTSSFILWNGTLGWCEGGYDAGTLALMAGLGWVQAYRIAGGGDTVAAIHKSRLEGNFNFISTGGGAMLEFLAEGTLPGIEAVRESGAH